MAIHKLGYVTASTFSPIIAGKGGKLLQGAKTYAHQIALERLCLDGYVDESYLEQEFGGNAYTEWGDTYEQEAIDCYEVDQFCEVTGQQNVYVHPDYPYLSCTVDGEVGDDGLIEVKCPAKAEKHLSNILYNAWIKDYQDQVQLQLFISGREWCDLISYDPRYVEDKRLHIARLTPDKEWQDNLIAQYQLFEQEVAFIINNFKK